VATGQAFKGRLRGVWMERSPAPRHSGDMPGFHGEGCLSPGRKAPIARVRRISSHPGSFPSWPERNTRRSRGRG